MKVITLNQQALTQSCQQLSEKVKHAGFQPDIVLGIKTGGVYIARKIASDLDVDNCREIAITRPSTSRKKRLFGSILKHLPVSILNLLRIMEARLFFNRSSRRLITDIELPNLNITTGTPSILIVDDAVDSGETLKAIHDKSMQSWPMAAIRTAVITVTSKSPAIMPDYYLFNDSTLIRFPWSMDSSEQQ